MGTRKVSGKVKAAGVMLTMSPRECQMVYKNMVASTRCEMCLRRGHGRLISTTVEKVIASY